MLGPSINTLRVTMKRDAKVQTDQVQIFKVLRLLSDLPPLSQVNVMQSPWAVANKRQAPECWIIADVVGFSTDRTPLVEALKDPFRDSFLETEAANNYPTIKRLIHTHLVALIVRAEAERPPRKLPPSLGTDLLEQLSGKVRQRHMYFTPFWQLETNYQLSLNSFLILYLIFIDQVLAPALVSRLAEYAVVYILEAGGQPPPKKQLSVPLSPNPPPFPDQEPEEVDWSLVDKIEQSTGPGDAKIATFRIFIEAFQTAVSQWRRANSCPFLSNSQLSLLD